MSVVVFRILCLFRGHHYVRLGTFPVTSEWRLVFGQCDRCRILMDTREEW